MPADADARTDGVRDGPPARVVQALGHGPEGGARADGGLPGAVVHAELLEVDQVDDDGAVDAAEAVVSGGQSVLSRDKRKTMSRNGGKTTSEKQSRPSQKVKTRTHTSAPPTWAAP
jgi:hypothetical protein